jgi:GT2 family glycosyltransferase
VPPSADGGDGRGRVAVILVDFNAGDLLPRALRCLQEQTRRPDRTVVVDNASTDGSAEEVERDFPDVEVLRMGANVGFAAANNAGVAAVGDCEWVALLNTDAFAEPTWLAALLEAAADAPGAASFGSRMMRAGAPQEIDGTGDVYHVSGFAWRRDHGRVLATAPDALRREEIFSACAAAALYRRDAYLAAGGLDERFFTYHEDVDLGFRLRLDGHACLYVPASVVQHVGSATAGADSDHTVFYSQRNMVWTWVKNMPWPLALLYLPQHVLVNALMIAWYLTRGRGPLVLRAKRDALRGLPRVLAERRAVQRRRRVGAAQVRAPMARGLTGYVAGAGRAAGRSTGTLG